MQMAELTYIWHLNKMEYTQNNSTLMDIEITYTIVKTKQA